MTFNVDLRDYSSTTVGIYSDIGCSTKVGDLQSATESDTFTFTNVPNGTYYVGIKTGTTASIVKAVSDEITISDEGATLTQLHAEVEGMTIVYSATFSSQATDGYTIGIYSDEDCETVVSGSVNSVEGDIVECEYTVSGYQTYFIGVKTGGGELLGTTTARPNPVISFTTTGNQQIGYKIELDQVTSGLKVWAIEYSSGTLVGSNVLASGVNMGSFTVSDSEYHYRVFINDIQDYESAFECIETSVYEIKSDETIQDKWPGMGAGKARVDVTTIYSKGYGTGLKASIYSDSACSESALVEGPYEIPTDPSADRFTVSFTHLDNGENYYFAVFDGEERVFSYPVDTLANPFTNLECDVLGNEITVNITATSNPYGWDYYCYLAEADGETQVYRVKLTDADKNITSQITFETANVQYDHDYKVIVTSNEYGPSNSHPYWVEDVNVPYIVLNITIDSSSGKLDVQVNGISTDYYSGTMGLYTDETCSTLVKDAPQQMGTNPVGSGFIMDFNQVSGTYYIGIIGKRTSSDTDTILYTEKVVT